MQLGLSHRQTVLVIYGLSLVFAFISMLYPLSTLWGSVLLTIGVLIGLELFIESIGLLGDNRQPLLHAIQKFIKRLEKKISRRRYSACFFVSNNDSTIARYR
jgi:hypothetical protein